MPFLPAVERERVHEFIRRYNGQNIPEDDLLLFMASVYSEARQTERRECVKLAAEVMLNAAKFRPKEVSETGLELQRGRRLGAEDVISKINGRAALTLEQDNQAFDYPEAALRDTREED